MKAIRILVVALLSVSVFAVASPSDAAPPGDSNVVEVSTVAELTAAVDGGARRVLVAPGDYLIEAPIDLTDIELVGLGAVGTASVAKFIVDPTSPDLFMTPAVWVSGTVLIENLSFEGLVHPVLGYVGSAPAVPGIDRHSITIRNSRFVTADFAARSSFILGNNEAATGSPHTSVIFEDNYVQGGFLGIAVGNFFSTAPGAHVDATIARNEFHVPYTTILVTGQIGGLNGSVTGRSVANEIYDTNRWTAPGYGLSVLGGTDDVFNPGAPGGSDARVNWTSTRDRFINNGIGIAVWGGHRHGDIWGPSMGNQVRAKIIDPYFENSALRDVDILGSSAYEFLPANGIAESTIGPGNTVEVLLRQSDFDGESGRVWIKNAETGDGLFGRFDSPVPPMPTEPSYGNTATFTGSMRAFERTNPGANAIPAAFFTGGPS